MMWHIMCLTKIQTTAFAPQWYHGIVMNMGSPFARKSGAAIQSLAFAEDRSQPIQIRFASFIMPSCFVFPAQKTLTGEGPHRMAMKTDVLPLSHRFDEMVPTQLLSLLRSFNTGK